MELPSIIISSTVTTGNIYYINTITTIPESTFIEYIKQDAGTVTKA